LQNGDQGSLAIDFTNTNIDLTSENTSGYSISELFNAIKSATGNNDLDVNAIKLQVDTDPTAGTT
jgi:hypothetical protein